MGGRSFESRRARTAERRWRLKEKRRAEREEWREGRSVRGDSGGRAAADGRARSKSDEGAGERRAG